MRPFEQALLLSSAAGAAIPLGGWLARIERIGPRWLKTEVRHGVIAFGGGAFPEAVALVLVPDGIEHLSMAAAVTAFLGGSVVFMLADWGIAKMGGSASQPIAMMMDFIPEAMALGASLAAGESMAPLLAFLIALQNVPEGFNSYREIRASGGIRPGGVLGVFGVLALAGPLSAWIGLRFLADQKAVLGTVMVFAAGGILYLIFEDIAPQAKLRNRWAPAMGGVLGFLLGLAGHMLINQGGG